MSDLENRVIGGPHHREYHDFPDRDHIRLPIRQLFPRVLPTELPSIDTVTRTQGYRKHRFTSTLSDGVVLEYRVWLPDDVPQAKIMAHVLGLALKAKP